MVHFVYRLTLLEPWDERKYYIGKHSSKYNDIGIKYFSSGKLQQYFKDFPNKVSIKIINKFKTVSEAIKFEGLIHQRLNVKDNILFFNEQNQTLLGKIDRTKRVTVIDNYTREKSTISTSTYYNNIDKYTSINKGNVICKDDSGNYILLNKDEFDRRDDVKGVNSGILHVTDIKSGKNITVSKNEFDNNRELYYHSLQGKISVYDTKLNIKSRISKEDFDNDRYIGIKKFTGEGKRLCNICENEISLSNYDRHQKAHNNHLIWVTDNLNLNSYKVTEFEYYTKLKENYYIIPKNRDKTIGYINGVPHNIRYVGRINKEFKGNTHETN